MSKIHRGIPREMAAVKCGWGRQDPRGCPGEFPGRPAKFPGCRLPANSPGNPFPVKFPGKRPKFPGKFGGPSEFLGWGGVDFPPVRPIPPTFLHHAYNALVTIGRRATCVRNIEMPQILTSATTPIRAQYLNPPAYDFLFDGDCHYLTLPDRGSKYYGRISLGVILVTWEVRTP